ncbi:MAG: 5'/3'-nucleotidase SurE, partial [Gordonia amarae]
RYDTAAEVAVRVADWMIRTENTRLMLNVNVPDVDFADLRGVAATKLGARSMFALRTERADGDVILRRDERSSGFRPGTDSAAVAGGYVSVTVLKGITGSDDHAALDDSGDSLIQILDREASSAT